MGGQVMSAGNAGRGNLWVRSSGEYAYHLLGLGVGFDSSLLLFSH